MARRADARTNGLCIGGTGTPRREANSPEVVNYPRGGRTTGQIIALHSNEEADQSGRWAINDNSGHPGSQPGCTTGRQAGVLWQRPEGIHPKCAPSYVHLLGQWQIFVGHSDQE